MIEKPHISLLTKKPILPMRETCFSQLLPMKEEPVVVEAATHEEKTDARIRPGVHYVPDHLDKLVYSLLGSSLCGCHNPENLRVKPKARTSRPAVSWDIVFSIDPVWNRPEP